MRRTRSSRGRCASKPPTTRSAASGGRRELLMEDFGTAHATDEKAARARVAGIAAALEKTGFPAGAPSTSRLFALP